MTEQVAQDRAQAIDGFAAALRALREAAGNPSFREMSGRSRAISHTTLHEAAQGNRLPSWSTTVEFVKACAADPADYRERWDDASRAVSARTPNPAPSPVPSPVLPPASGPTPVGLHVSPHPARAGSVDRGPHIEPDLTLETLVGPARPVRSGRHTVHLAVAAAAVAAAAIGVGLAVRSGSGDAAQRAAAPVAARFSAADCPVRQADPRPAVAVHQGDVSAFIADITLPDCSRIRAGEQVVKTWRFKNIGTVRWTGYSLHRLDVPQQRDQCQTISDIPIADTVPGALVDISTMVTAPPHAGFCFVRFKMVDASGQVAFPGSRPVNFQVVVD